MGDHFLQKILYAQPTRSNQIILSPKGLVATSGMLDASLLALLLNEQVSAIRVTGFYPADLCALLSDWLFNHKNRTVYGQNAVDPNTGKIEFKDYFVDRIGEPRNRLIGKPADTPEWEEYFRKGETLRIEIEQLTRYRHPIQMVIDMINRNWAHGAMREEIHGRPSPAGIGRVTRPARSDELHPMEDPHVDGPWPCALHLSMNIYFSLPEHGGELETFCGPTLSAEEMQKIRFDHKFRESHLESELVKPEVGDLIMINTRRPHAVMAFSEGPRVTYASFVMYDPERPLRFYS